MVVPSGYINQAHLAAEIERVRQKLGPEVVHLKYSVGPDTGGEASIYFWIVLTDSASRRENLGDVTEKIVTLFFDELHPYENWGLNPYFSFRSQSEHAVHHELEWA
jgi:hypothetical protein